MSIGFIVLIVVVLILVIGPVMMLRPDPIQKNKETLRMQARAKGIHFSMRNLPQQNTEQEKPAPIPVYFFAPVKPQFSNDWLLLRASYEHDIHFLGVWAWQNDIQATVAEQAILKQYLPQLPDSVKAVSAGSQGICVYWNEKGGEEVLQDIIALMEALQSLHVTQD